MTDPGNERWLGWRTVLRALYPAILIPAASPVSDVHTATLSLTLLGLGLLSAALTWRRVHRRPVDGFWTRALAGALEWGTRSVLWLAGALSWAVLVFPFLFAYEPWVATGTTLVVVLAVWWTRRRSGPRLTVYSLFPVSTLVLVAVLVDHYGGASDRECQAVYDRPFVRAILDREALDRLPGLRGVFPYALEPDGQGRLFISMKDRTDGYLPGYDPTSASNGLVVLAARDGRILHVEPLRAVGDSARPEDLHYDPGTGTLSTFVVHRSIPHELRIYDVGDDRISLRARTEFPDWEPTGLAGFHEKPGILVGFNGPVLWEASLPDLRDGRWSRTEKVAPVTFFAGLDVGPADRFALAASVSGSALLLDGDGWRPLESIDVLDGTGAVRISHAGDRAWLTGYARGHLYAYDLGSRTVVGRASTTRTGKWIAEAPDRGLLFVSGYHTGELVVHDTRDLEEVARLELGSLLRPLAYDSRSGKVIAGSSCGILELDLDSWLPRR